jgi:hypothetical protein
MSIKHTVKVEVANSPTARRLDISQRLMECGEMYAFSLSLLRVLCNSGLHVAVCGVRHGLYPCKTTDHGSTHYFIEFKHSGSVDRALRLKLNHARVYSLVMNPSLVKDFFSVAPSSSDQPRHSPSQSSHNPKRTEPVSVPSKPKTARPHGSDTPPDANVVSSPATQLTTPLHLPPHTESIFQALKSSPTPITKRNDSSGVTIQSANKSQQDPDSHRPTALSIPPAIPLKNAISLPSPITPSTPSVAIGPLSSMEKRIVMSLCGEKITYDLGALEDDPGVIIQLLKATSSERGNWMTVAGQYRRNRNPTAALAVVTELVKGKPSYNLIMLNNINRT